jgi:VanZ family protein
MFNPLSPVNRTKLATFSEIALAAFWLALIAATHIPPNAGLQPPRGSDKLAHFGAYAALSFLIATTWQLNAGVLTGRHLFFVWLTVALFGVVDEVTQLAVGRDCTFGDWTADALGAAAGVLIFVWLRRIVERTMSSKELKN